jgi:hypothetical protein
MTILWDTERMAVETHRFAIGDPVQLLETGPCEDRIRVSKDTGLMNLPLRV